MGSQSPHPRATRTSRRHRQLCLQWPLDSSPWGVGSGCEGADRLAMVGGVRRRPTHRKRLHGNRVCLARTRSRCRARGSVRTDFRDCTSAATLCIRHREWGAHRALACVLRDVAMLGTRCRTRTRSCAVGKAAETAVTAMGDATAAGAEEAVFRVFVVQAELDSCRKAAWLDFQRSEGPVNERMMKYNPVPMAMVAET
ncbi:hypothetical protein BC830DRAFT_703447 [Chytriomyces sp. MP71]|nr:hypothetical protein BC830DRAFT_703447 [Chytriomyces sp. MP71]